MPIDSVSSGMPCSRSSRAQSASSANNCRCASKPSRGGGMHIRPRSCSRGNSTHAARQRRELRLGDSALAGLVGEPHLDADIERRRVRGALLAEADGDALAIERVDPVKVLGDGARLVRLQLADEVPRQRQVGELGELRQRFLQVVFAEIALAQLGHRADRVRRAVSCDTAMSRTESGIATVPHCSGCDAVPCFDESLPYIAGGRATGLISRKVRTS